MFKLYLSDQTRSIIRIMRTHNFSFSSINFINFCAYMHSFFFELAYIMSSGLHHEFLL